MTAYALARWSERGQGSRTTSRARGRGASARGQTGARRTAARYSNRRASGRIVADPGGLTQQL
jgi:hypothetical protein